MRFTIRDLLWLTLVSALALGWGTGLVNYLLLNQRTNALQEKVDILAGMMRQRGYYVHVEGQSGVAMSSKPINKIELPRPPAKEQK